MSLYGLMRTSTSGMAAQASRISIVAENVANANTVGYKGARSEFQSFFIGDGINNYNSGTVSAEAHRLVESQGGLTGTGNVTDLAIDGEGMMLVQDPNGGIFLTRSGSFTADESGNLVNTAGFVLMGYPYNGTTPVVVANGFAGLVPINVSSLQLLAEPSMTGNLAANLPSGATAVPAADLPSTNSATAQFTAKTSLVVFGNLGEEVTLDVYYSMTAAGTWEATTYNAADAAAGGGFPYTSGPLSTDTLTFDPANGQLAGASPTSITIPVPGGQNFNLDISGMTQLATSFTILDATANGNAASVAEIVEISDEGLLYVAFANGSRRPLYQIPLATVPSPDRLSGLSGNVYSANSKSGNVRIGFPNSAGFGGMRSGTLEQSTTDIATEFTEMIDAQRTYTANSKVFQTGAELMDVLVNLKR
jgi:flagellar hook protein FlgE